MNTRVILTTKKPPTFTKVVVLYVGRVTPGAENADFTIL